MPRDLFRQLRKGSSSAGWELWKSTRFRYTVAVPAIALFPALSLMARVRRRWQELMLGALICAMVCIYETLVLFERETIFQIRTGNATLNYCFG